MKCPVCETGDIVQNGKKKICTRCGYDATWYLEMTQPDEVLPPTGPKQPPTPGLPQNEEGGKNQKKLLPLLIAAAAVLSLGLGIWFGTGIDRAEHAQLWEHNVLRAFELNDLDSDGIFTKEEAWASSVFGCADYRRDQIRSITVLDTLDDAPEDAWDVSESGNGTVLAWVKPNDELYDLYLAGKGGIRTPENARYLFAGYKNASSITLGDAFHTDGTVNMSYMFYHCDELNDLTIGEFDTSNVQSMKSMFYYCEDLETLVLSSFNTRKVTDMSYMFYNCTALTNLTRGDEFVTDQADTTKMLYGVGEPDYDKTDWKKNILRNFKLNDADKDGTLTVEEEMKSSVFNLPYRREQISSITILDTLVDAPEDASDVSEAQNGKVMAWVTPNGALYDLYIAGEGGVSSGKYPGHMFAGYVNATKMDFGNAFHTDKAESMLAMFYGCKKLEKLDLSGFVTSNVTNMGYMFDSCEALTELTLGEQFDTAKVENMQQMFEFCGDLETLNLSKFDTSLVTDMSWMFANCTKLKNLTLGDRFIVGDDTDKESMYLNCPAGAPRWKSNVLKCYTVLDTDGNGALTVEEFAASAVFGSLYRREQISSITVLDTLKDAPEDAWDVSDDGSGNVMAWVRQNGEMYELYLAGEGGICIEGNTLFLFAGYTNAVSINLGEAFHTEGAQSMHAMFYGCKELVELHLSGFATSNVTDMRWMFAECTKLKNLTLGDSFIVGDNTDTEYMFLNCPAGDNYTHLVH